MSCCLTIGPKYAVAKFAPLNRTVKWAQAGSVRSFSKWTMRYAAMAAMGAPA